MTTNTTDIAHPLLATRLPILDRHVAAQSIARYQWSSMDEHGRVTLCMLAALSPEALAAQKADACPSDLLPTWLTELVPLIDDDASETAWWPTVTRLTSLLHSSVRWDRARWRRLEAAWFLAALDLVEMGHRPVYRAWERVFQGDEPTAEEWESAHSMQDYAPTVVRWTCRGDHVMVAHESWMEHRRLLAARERDILSMPTLGRSWDELVARFLDRWEQLCEEASS